MNSFEQTLAEGRVGESDVARWFISRGWGVLPAYEKEFNDHKGPRVFSASGQIVAPDMLVFKRGKVFWVEAKNKSAFTYHRKSGHWVTGVDQHHFDDYLRIADISGWPIWLMFVQRPGTAKDSPPDCPTGLFGGDISDLAISIHHAHKNGGPHGMVYWAVPPLKKICSLMEIAA